MHQTADQGVLPNPYMPEAFMAAAYDLTDHESPLAPCVYQLKNQDTIKTTLVHAYFS